MEAIDSAIPRPVKHVIKQVLPISPIYRAVQWFTADKPSVVEVRRGALTGRRFRCNLKYERWYWLGAYEVELERLLLQWLQPGDVFYDVGTHKGYFSLIAATKVGANGMVIGFEPNPSNVAESLTNFRLNPDLSPRIQLHAVAAVDVSGLVRFAGRAHQSTGRVVPGSSAAGTYVVNGISLDDFLGQGHPAPTIIKMDIEGGERWALRGMVDVLRRHRPLVAVEIHDGLAFDAARSVAEQCDYALEGPSSASSNAWTTRARYILRPK